MRKALLFCGWCWCATSPLVYTLQRKIKYAHFGYTKNFPYPSPQTKFILKKYIEGTWENYKSFEPSSHRMNTTEDLEPLKDFSIDYFKKLVTGVPTISKYIDYMIALHDHVVSKGYKSVGCSESSFKYQKALLSKFEVKCLFIVRDPIRRAFGQYMNAIQRVIDQSCPEGSQFNPRYKLPYELNVINYLANIDYCCEIYGKENVHMTVMEELWEDDGTARKKLSEFLGHPIDKLWKNLYAPDRGHLVKYDKDVPCQAYGQDQKELTPMMYYELLKKYQHVYDMWRERFGSLPMHWGKPITYE